MWWPPTIWVIRMSWRRDHAALTLDTWSLGRSLTNMSGTALGHSVATQDMNWSVYAIIFFHCDYFFTVTVWTCIISCYLTHLKMWLLFTLADQAKTIIIICLKSRTVAHWTNAYWTVAHQGNEKVDSCSPCVYVNMI